MNHSAGSQVLAWGRDPPPLPIPDSIFFKAYVDVCYTKKFIINAKYQWYIYFSYLANLYYKCNIHQRIKILRLCIHQHML